MSALAVIPKNMFTPRSDLKNLSNLLAVVDIERTITLLLVCEAIDLTVRGLPLDVC